MPQGTYCLTAPDEEEEQVFHIADRVFLGTKFGAANRARLDALCIRAVINVTGGGTRVPNHFAAEGIQYLHLELMDELITDPSCAVPQACQAISAFTRQGLNVLVHCQAGLSRSATVVLAWLMREKAFSLQEAVTFFAKQRGRRPKCNPSFFCYLAGLERELRAWPSGTPPSLDFTPWLLEDLESMGLSYSEEEVAKALHEDADWVHFALFYTSLCGWGFDRLMAAQCVAQRQRPGLAMAKKAAGTALELLEVYRALPAARLFCLRIIGSLASSGDVRLCSTLLAEGAVGKVLHAMFFGRGEAEIQEAGCAILAYLATSGPAGAHEVLSLGGVRLVLTAMRAHPDRPEAQAAACGALWALTGGPAARAEIVASGGTPAALEAMRRHLAAARVQEFACALLGSLVGEPQGWMAATSLGAAGIVAGVAALHPAEAALQRHAQRALVLLAGSPASGSKPHVLSRQGLLGTSRAPAAAQGAGRNMAGVRRTAASR